MDSPLEFLRRNQKTMLPVIAIGCMVAFVVLPGLLSMLQDRQNPQNAKDPVLARWQGGDIHASALQHEVVEHQQLTHFINQLLQQRFATGNFNVQDQFKIRELFGLLQYGPNSVPVAIDLKLFDQMGKDLGIVISDQQANNYFDEICTIPEVSPDGKPTGRKNTVVTSQAFNQTLKDLTKINPGFTEPRVFDLIKRLLMRAEVSRLFNLQNFFTAETPLARWDNYRRFRQRSAIQAIPVRVEEFVKGVREPSPDELSKFFEENKNRFADANSPEVGLRTPTRASFQLAYIDIDRLVSSFKPRIENKAISEYYEKNKFRFEKSKLPAVNTSPAIDPPAKQDDTKPAEGETKPMPATEPAKTEPAKTEPAKAEPAKTEPAKAEPAKGETPAPKQDATKKQSAVFRDGLTPVNFQADAKDAAKTEPAKAEPAKTEPAKSEPAKSEAAKTEPAKTEPAKADAAKSDATKADAPATEPAKPEPVEYKPLEEVESEIREILARQEANKQAELLMQKIEDEMFAYKKRRDRAMNAAEEGRKVEFAPFDIAMKTAEIDPTIQAETLTLVSREQFAKHPVSGSQVAHLQGNPLLLNVAFNEKALPVFEPIRPLWLTGRYIIWKTEQLPDEVPVLSDPDVKQRTIDAWKFVEARKDAEKQAQQFADIAKKAEKKDDKPQTLVDLFNAKVLPTAPSEIGSFSWMTLPTQSGEPPTLTKVSGLDNPGHDLMQTIFNLAQWQIGVAPNQPKSIFYVIQVTETSDLEKLRESFLQDVRTPFGWRQFEEANIDEQMTETRAFFENLRKRYKLEIVNEPVAVKAAAE